MCSVLSVLSVLNVISVLSVLSMFSVLSLLSLLSVLSEVSVFSADFLNVTKWKSAFIKTKNFTTKQSVANLQVFKYIF